MHKIYLWAINWTHLQKMNVEIRKCHLFLALFGIICWLHLLWYNSWRLMLNKLWYEGCDFSPCVSDLAATAADDSQMLVDGQLTDTELQTLCSYVLYDVVKSSVSLHYIFLKILSICTWIQFVVGWCCSLPNSFNVVLLKFAVSRSWS